MNRRMDSLNARAAKLDKLIRSEERRPAPDWVEVQAMKRRKLATRDELALLEAGLLLRN